MQNGASPAGPILEAKDVSIVFGQEAHGGTVAVDRASLAIAESPPRILSIVGESGSGKTTLARSLLGLSKPTRGQSLFRGKNIYDLNKDEMKVFRTDIQAVFQDPYGIYNPFYKIDRVFDMTIKQFKLASSKAEKRDLIEEALRAVNLRPPDVIGRHPHQLSGGERQRVMLARAYLLRPKVIIADEPISMLDVAVRATLMNIFLDFKERYGMSTLFITHDLSAAYYLGGDIMVMSRGRAVEDGPVDDVMATPAHPYTRLLLGSIPSPDPDHEWDQIALSPRQLPADKVHSRARCLFAERCPHVMDMCIEKRPPQYEVGKQHAACFLYHPEASSIEVIPKSTSARRAEAEAEATAVS